MSEVEIAPAPEGCCQWVELKRGRRSRAVRMHRCGEPAVDGTSLCRKHLLIKNPLAEFLRQQCKAPGTEAPGRSSDPEAERVTLDRNWPPGYDLGGDHD